MSHKHAVMYQFIMTLFSDNLLHCQATGAESVLSHHEAWHQKKLLRCSLLFFFARFLGSFAKLWVSAAFGAGKKTGEDLISSEGDYSIF